MKTESPARPTPARPKPSSKAKPIKKETKPVRKETSPAGPAPLASGSRGFITLVLGSGLVTSINAQAVHRNDRFDYAYGLKERLEHVPAEGDRGEITHFYAYARLKDGGYCFDVLSRAEVPVRGTEDVAERGKKLALRRIAGYLPIAAEAVAALADCQEPEEQVPAEEPAPQAVDLSEEELAGLFPPGHVMRILDAAAERDMPDEVLEEIVGTAIEEVSPEDEWAILRAIASWQA